MIESTRNLYYADGCQSEEIENERPSYPQPRTEKIDDDVFVNDDDGSLRDAVYTRLASPRGVDLKFHKLDFHQLDLPWLILVQSVRPS